MSMFYSNATCEEKSGANKFFVDNNTFPQSIALLKTRTEPIGVELVFGDYKTFEPTEDFFGAMVQYPNADGSVEDYRTLQQDVMMQAAACSGSDLLSLTLLTPPGEWGADAVVGTTASVFH